MHRVLINSPGHRETSSERQLEDLIARREMYSCLEAQQRLHDDAYYSNLFDILCPSPLELASTPSPRSSASNSPPQVEITWESHGRQAGSGEATARQRGRKEEERGWGAYGVDKWWVGAWGVRRSSSDSSKASPRS
jgi:hypothetical protein